MYTMGKQNIASSPALYCVFRRWDIGKTELENILSLQRLDVLCERTEALNLPRIWKQRVNRFGTPPKPGGQAGGVSLVVGLPGGRRDDGAMELCEAASVRCMYKRKW